MMKPLIALSVALFAGCDDPISYSEDVGISMKAEVVDGTIVDEKNINTESGNPYAAFVADARRTLGADPGSIEVDRVELALAAGSTVTELDQVFGGDVEVLFQMTDSDNLYLVASGNILPGITGPQDLEINFSSGAVDSIDYPKLLDGNFKVVTLGVAAPGFDGKTETANLQVTLSFAAYK
jgi:hypothetical protein